MSASDFLESLKYTEKLVIVILICVLSSYFENIDSINNNINDNCNDINGNIFGQRNWLLTGLFAAFYMDRETVPTTLIETLACQRAHTHSAVAALLAVL